MITSLDYSSKLINKMIRSKTQYFPSRTKVGGSVFLKNGCRTTVKSFLVSYRPELTRARSSRWYAMAAFFSISELALLCPQSQTMLNTEMAGKVFLKIFLRE